MLKIKNTLQKRCNSLFVANPAFIKLQKGRLSIDSSHMKENKSGKTILQTINKANTKVLNEQGSNRKSKRPSNFLNMEKSSLFIESKSHCSNSFKITNLLNSFQIANISIKNILRILQNYSLLIRKQSNLFTVKVQDLEKLLSKVLFYKTSLEKQKIMQKHDEFNNYLSNISKLIDSQKKKDKINRFGIIQTIQEQISRKDFQHEVCNKKSQICQLQSLKQSKQAALFDLNEAMRQSYSHKQAISKIIALKQRQLDQLSSKCNLQEKILADLETEISKKSQFLENVRKNELAIRSFVDCQEKSKIIKMVSQDYKNIESDLYQYAVYLQANQLASSLTYEHLPVICHTHSLEDEVNNLRKCLIRDQQVTITDKCRKLKDFLMVFVEKYRKKDVQAQKLMNFKTKWIIKFVEKMKMWLSNWELKQEYLKNLRIQYAFIHKQVLSLLKKEKTERHQTYCQSCNEAIIRQRQAVHELFLKIDQNYKMGNSFY